MSQRPDLLALDDDALVILANRGLVKRATKDLEKGNGPAIEVRDDGTIVGKFSDVITTMAPGVAFKETECTCGATRACRHRVATVLAYQAQNRGVGFADERPTLDIDDDALRERLGDAVYRAARKQRDRGYSATVRFGKPPVVLLPTCTVTFLVPWDLAHVRCDCVAGVNCEHVAMAVWALQQSPSDDGEHLVSLSDGTDDVRGQEVLSQFTALADELIRGGWAGALQGIEPRVAPVRAALRKQRFVWLEDLLESLLTAMRDNEQGLANADAFECSHLLTEIHMRCSAQPTAKAPRGHLHGEGVAGETKLDHVVLRGLGARYRVFGRVGHLSVFFRERGSNDALVLERSWTVDEGNRPPPGPAIGRRRLIGTTVDMLATSNITTRGATRRPNRVIDVSSQRLQTSVMRGSGQRLEAEDNYGALRDRFAARIPQTMGPRVRAWRVVVIKFGDVEQVGYDPGTRTVWGVLADTHGNRLTVASEWHPEAPAGPGLLARALTDGANYLTAEAHLRGGSLWLEPLTIGFDAPLAVDLHPDVEIPDLPKAPIPLPDDPLVLLVHTAHEWLGDAARRGIANLTNTQLDEAERLADRLTKGGLTELGGLLQRLADTERTSESWRVTCAQIELAAHVLARSALNGLPAETETHEC